MIWVAWRQHRVGVLSALGVVLAAVILMVVMRFVIGADLAARGVPECLTDSERCPLDDGLAVRNYYSEYLNLWPILLLVLPMLLGVVAGTPLYARELSHGSHVFSLTQSVSRTRWWAVKLAVTLVPLTVGVLVLNLVTRWSLGPMLDWLHSEMAPLQFELLGPVAVGQLLLGFAIAATVGLLTRNNVVPVVVGLTACLFVALSLVFFARPHYLAPETVTVKVDTEMRTPENMWQVDFYYNDRNGERQDPAAGCGTPPRACDYDDFVTESVEYHPPSRFWLFQGIETGIYLVLTAVVLAVGARRLRSLPLP